MCLLCLFAAGVLCGLRLRLFTSSRITASCARQSPVCRYRLHDLVLFRDKNSRELSQPHPGGEPWRRVLARGWEQEETSECKERTQNQSNALGRGAMSAFARGGGGIVTGVTDSMFRAGHRWTAPPRRVLSGKNFCRQKAQRAQKSGSQIKRRGAKAQSIAEGTRRNFTEGNEGVGVRGISLFSWPERCSCWKSWRRRPVAEGGRGARAAKYFCRTIWFACRSQRRGVASTLCDGGVAATHPAASFFNWIVPTWFAPV